MEMQTEDVKMHIFYSVTRTPILILVPMLSPTKLANIIETQSVNVTPTKICWKDTLSVYSECSCSFLIQMKLELASLML